MDEYRNRKILSMEIKKVTPEIALKILEGNKSNRNLSWRTVQAYAIDMKRGAWRLTHEAIALNEKGEIIDGQHRLWAAAESKTTQWFYVAVYAGEDSALMMPIDIGRSRTATDITNIPTRDVAVIRTIARVVSARAKLPNDLVARMWETIGSHIGFVDDSHTRLFSIAPVRAAVILRHACGVDWTAQYSALVRKQHKVMDPITEALFNKLLDTGALYGGRAQIIKFCYAWHASSPVRKNQKVFRTSCVQEALEEAEASVQHLLPKEYAQIKTLNNMASKVPSRAKVNKK